MRLTNLVSVIALSLAAAATANAAQITSASDPALSGGSVITFDDLSNQTTSSLTQQGVTFTGNGDLRVDNSYAGQYNTRGAEYLDNNAGGTNQLTFTFATPVSAFGFLWGASDDTWALNAYNASGTLIESYYLSPTNSSNAGEFYGLSDAGIAYATLTDSAPGDYVMLDNFTYTAGTSQAVPEPASMVLLGAGLLGLGGLRRRMQGRLG